MTDQSVITQVQALQGMLNEAVIEIRALRIRVADLERKEQPAGGYASIYVHDSSTAQSIASGATYTKSTAWTSDGYSGGITPAAANDEIELDVGDYVVIGAFSFKSAKANINVLGALFLDGVEQDQIHWRRKIGTANDEGVTAFTGTIRVDTDGEAIDFRLRHDDGVAVNVTITYANLTVFRAIG